MHRLCRSTNALKPLVLGGVEVEGQAMLALHHSGVDRRQEGAWQGEVSTLDKTTMAQRLIACQVLRTMIGMTDLTDTTDIRLDLQLMQGHLSWTAWVLLTTEGQQGKLTLLRSKPCLLLRYCLLITWCPILARALTFSCVCSPSAPENACHQLWLLMGRRNSCRRYTQQKFCQYDSA